MARYWVGGTGTWDYSTTTHWSASNGGSGGASVPVTADDVYFTSSSGGGTCTIPATVGINSLTTASYTGTLLNNSSISLHSNMVFGASATFSGNGLLVMADTGSITSNGKTTSWEIVVSSIGTVTLADALSTTSYVQFEEGTFNTAGYAISSKYFKYPYLLQSGVLNMTNTTWTITGPGAAFSWHVLPSTGLTLITTGSTIILANSLTASQTFEGGGFTYNNVEVATTGAYPEIITGSNTFNNLKIDAGRTVEFTDGTTQTVSSFTSTGTALNPITLTGTSTAGWTISDSAGTNTAQHTTISYSHATGGATWDSFISQSNVNGGNNTGWIWNAHPGNFLSFM